MLQLSGLPRRSDSLLYTELEGAAKPGESENVETSKKSYRSIDDLDYEFLCFFLYNSRDRLYAYIDQRCEEMLTGECISALVLLKEL